MMRIWLLDPWDALPGEIGFERGWQVARALAAAGHEVLWWQSGFAHAEKRVRAAQFERRRLAAGIEVALVPVPAYRDNVSVKRLVSVAGYARAFARYARREPKPDALMVSGPIFFLEPVLLRLRRRHGVPIVFEFRDLWPETIILAARGPSRWLRWMVFGGARWMRRRLFRRCDAIVGLNRTYLEIALREAGSRPDVLAGVAYPSPEPAPPPAPAAARWVKPPGEVWAISAGTLGASHDHRTLVQVAARVGASHPRLRIFVTGGGPNAPELQALAAEAGLENLSYLGALPAEEFRTLLGRCDVGLALYREFSPVVFPTKIVDYLLAGLAVVTSAKSEAGARLEETGAGRMVPAEDAAAAAAALAALVEPPERLAAARAAASRLGGEFLPQRQIAVIVDLLERVGRKQTGGKGS